MSGPQLVAGFDSPWFAKDATGTPITRDRTCTCGRAYTQGMLSERFLATVEQRGKRATDELVRQIREFSVPIECPSCERLAIRREADRAQWASGPQSEAAD